MRRGRSGTRDGRPTLVASQSNSPISHIRRGRSDRDDRHQGCSQAARGPYRGRAAGGRAGYRVRARDPGHREGEAQEGKVLAVGPGRFDDKGARVPVDVQVGDVVLYSKYGGTEVKYSGQEYL